MALSLKNNKRIHLNRDEALKELKSEKMVTMTILVPLSLKEDVKIKTIQNKTNVTNLILEFLRTYVNKEGETVTNAHKIEEMQDHLNRLAKELNDLSSELKDIF